MWSASTIHTRAAIGWLALLLLLACGGASALMATLREDPEPTGPICRRAR